jgi:hypothetical protein
MIPCKYFISTRADASASEFTWHEKHVKPAKAGIAFVVFSGFPSARERRISQAIGPQPLIAPKTHCRVDALRLSTPQNQWIAWRVLGELFKTPMYCISAITQFLSYPTPTSV